MMEHKQPTYGIIDVVCPNDVKFDISPYFLDPIR